MTLWTSKPAAVVDGIPNPGGRDQKTGATRGGPTSAARVGGDFLDVFEIDRDRMGLLLGDLLRLDGVDGELEIAGAKRLPGGGSAGRSAASQAIHFGRRHPNAPSDGEYLL